MKRFLVVGFTHPDKFSGASFDNSELVEVLELFATIQQAEVFASATNSSWEVVAQIIDLQLLEEQSK